MKITPPGLTVISAIAGALALGAPHSALGQNAPFGPLGGSGCRVCEPTSNLTKDLEVPVPEHAIVLDFGNGVFWRNSRLVVIDLDRKEARTYRFPPDASQPTKLALMGSQPLTDEVKQDLVRKANLIWNPPPPEGLPALPPTDVFETVYVVNGPEMAQRLGASDRPAWWAALKEAIRAVQVR